ncbi:MAG: dephospho-CoA kinase [Chloroflexi bacterium]|nr:dephospho-CoA kinase [Chloroflexota bacterium]
MRVIGLTGGIASGKSLVSRQLAEHGAEIIDADTLGHEAYRKGTGTHRAVVEAFGPDVAGADGEIDRKALGAKVFGNPEARRRLEAIVWPAIRRLAEERLADLRANGAAIAVLEAAVLIEADWVPLVDEVWLVAVSPETARWRLMERNGLSPEQAEARLRAQLPNEKRRPYAQVVIENDGTVEELRRAVDEAWSKLQANARS